MDLLDRSRQVEGRILVITLKSETARQPYEGGVQVVITHTPEVFLAASVSEANKRLLEEDVRILGAWEIKRDLSGAIVREPVAINTKRTVLDISRLGGDESV